jgi:hypothetical protein
MTRECWDKFERNLVNLFHDLSGLGCDCSNSVSFSEATQLISCCLAEGDAIGTITTESGEIVEEIHQISLELHQRGSYRLNR